jgi:hypothetical protein
MGGSSGASAGRRMLAGPDSRDREITPVGDVRGDGPAGVLIDWRLPLIMIKRWPSAPASAGDWCWQEFQAGGWRLAAGKSFRLDVYLRDQQTVCVD